eukprot:TRINITY_DN8749_c0_g1_i2.p1 TRINITY_DN8749_c0_g1~~TRINITY_DN8749_c0_g1_i2.p1  ORF type:complete len:294 (+),score=18.84 TRINITY_DN8749_c0_g1_i2:190-1071(+)
MESDQVTYEMLRSIVEEEDSVQAANLPSSISEEKLSNLKNATDLRSITNLSEEMSIRVWNKLNERLDKTFRSNHRGLGSTEPSLALGKINITYVSGHSARTFTIHSTETEMIGRKSNRFGIPLDKTVSSKHITICWYSKERSFVIKDEGSLNGTYLKSSKTELTPGKLIELGNVIYQVEIDSASKTLTLKAKNKKVIDSAQDLPIMFDSSRSSVTIGGIDGNCIYKINDPGLDSEHVRIDWIEKNSPIMTSLSDKQFWIRLQPGEEIQISMIPTSPRSKPTEIRLGSALLTLS